MTSLLKRRSAKRYVRKRKEPVMYPAPPDELCTPAPENRMEPDLVPYRVSPEKRQG